MVVGATSGYTFDQIRYWINSLDRSGFAGQRVVLVGNGDDNLVRQLGARGCQVVTRAALIGSSADADGPTTFLDRDMCVERYLLLWKFLSCLSADDVGFVIFVDMRDAIFQLNPSKWLVDHIGEKKLVVSSEGLKYADEPWNRQSLREAFGPAVFDYMQDRLVWNCGTIAGELGLLRELSLNLYLCSRTVAYADQAALNVLLSLEPYSGVTFFDRGEAGWACEAATMVGSARGPDLSYKFAGLEPLFDGDAVYTRGGRPYCVVHQYDRIPAWKVRLEKRFA